jgi:hypothetical protein
MPVDIKVIQEGDEPSSRKEIEQVERNTSPFLKFSSYHQLEYISDGTKRVVPVVDPEAHEVIRTIKHRAIRLRIACRRYLHTFKSPGESEKQRRMIVDEYVAFAEEADTLTLLFEDPWFTLSDLLIA